MGQAELFAGSLNIPSGFRDLATRGSPENERGESRTLMKNRLFIVQPLVHFPIVLVISAKSLVLLRNYVKILKLAADPGPETGNSKLLRMSLGPHSVSKVLG